MSDVVRFICMQPYVKQIFPAKMAEPVIPPVTISHVPVKQALPGSTAKQVISYVLAG